MNLKKLGLVTLATLMLVGCGAKKTETGAEATASPEATAETETEAEKTGEMDMSEIMAQAGDGTSAKNADLSGYTLVEGESAVLSLGKTNLKYYSTLMLACNKTQVLHFQNLSLTAAIAIYSIL
jgi:hypothetical protein